MTTTTQTFVTVGSIVRTDRGTMIVHKVNPKNLVCYDEAGNGWNVNRNRGANLTDAPFDRTNYDAFLEKQRERNNMLLNETLHNPLFVGTIVCFVDSNDAKKWPGEYVVISQPTAAGRIKIAKLGGDGGRYVNGPADMVRKV